MKTQIEMVECSCSVSDVCPQGKKGQEPRCRIWLAVNVKSEWLLEPDSIMADTSSSNRGSR